MMLKQHNPFIFVLSSPSGAGKTTITRKLLETDDKIEMSVSVTTRPKRYNEIEGQDYYFKNKDVFQEMIRNDQLAEYAKVFGHYYGSPQTRIDEILAKGKDVLFDIDWQGTKQLKEKMPDKVISLYILPPSMKELERRLKERKSDDDQVIKHRMACAKLEISHWDNYDYVIINDNVESCLSLVKSILAVERLKHTDTFSVADKLLNYQV